MAEGNGNGETLQHWEHNQSEGQFGGQIISAWMEAKKINWCQIHGQIESGQIED